ncbi:MAG TPA: dihydrofolate reductase family protein [Chitinophagaceae bacterium]|nr:dihydrofolate reductase family protein [Chitinophagaceae bacterium]
MRTLKLQMQISVDGFVAGPNGELDWMEWNWDDEIKNYVNELTDSVDTILLGRKMTEDFISHWSNIVMNKPDDPSYPFAKKMVDKPKVVFSKTLKESPWENTVIANDVVDEINKLKSKNEGTGIIVYGGATFVSSLIENNLIDEYYLFVNPASIGNGLSIFKERKKFKLVKSTPFSCSIVLLNYEPVKNKE